MKKKTLLSLVSILFLSAAVLVVAREKDNNAWKNLLKN